MRPIMFAAVASFLLGAALVAYYFWPDGDVQSTAELAAPETGADADLPANDTDSGLPEPTPTAIASEAAAASVAAAGAAQAVTGNFCPTGTGGALASDLLTSRQPWPPNV